MPEIVLKPVDSSMIESTGYDPETQTLRIRFKTGAVYDYTPVSHGMWLNFQHAPSVGSYFHANIKGNFSSIKVG